MIEHKADSILAGRIEDKKAEIASKDYQVTKAARLGVSVDDIYPGHVAWYQQKMTELHELEEIERQQKEANDRLNKLAF